LVALSNSGTDHGKDDTEQRDPQQPPTELGPSVRTTGVVIVVVAAAAVQVGIVVSIDGVVDVVASHLQLN
jgi:hypothetical protein